MTPASHVNVRWPALVAGALALVGAGAITTYVSLHSTGQAPRIPGANERAPAARSADQSDSASMTTAPLKDVVVPLSKEVAERAGIAVSPVRTGSASGSLRAPAVIEPNAYKLVTVTPLTSGRITRVAAELGQHVTAGQTLAEIFSPELAEWQTQYISVRAELQAHERELARTEKLAEIGAASRQELERIHAEHTSRRASLQSAASRLRLLGLSEAAVEALDPGRTLDATISVPAPIRGVVTERIANVGLNVDPASKLFTVVDLSTVWAVAAVHEKDFARVRIGALARVTSSAYPDVEVQGRVSYIDPQVNADSRTAQIRVEVPNVRGELRLGMFVDVLLGADAADALLIPQTAIQNVGDRSVVYLVDPQNGAQFIEREVHPGAQTGDDVSVLAGVRPGDRVVSAGSFSVRAERERLGLRPATAPVDGGQRSGESVQTAKIELAEQGYEPATVNLRAGVLARLTFIRTTDKTCGTEIVFPSLKIKRALPLKQPVVIEFTPSEAGNIDFVCGMNMLKGTVVVRAE